VIQPKLSLGVLVHPSVRHRCLTLRTSWRRDMFRRQRGRGKVRRCLLAMGHSMSSQTAFPLRGINEVVLREHHTFGGEARRHLPLRSFSPGHPPKATSPDGVGQITDRHGVTDSASQQIQRHTVVVRCKPTA